MKTADEDLDHPHRPTCERQDIMNHSDSTLRQHRDPALNYDPFTAWADIQPTDWRSAIWSMAVLACRDTEEYRDLQDRETDAIGRVFDLDPQLGHILEDVSYERVSHAIAFASVFGFGAARTFPARIEDLHLWLGRAYAYAHLRDPMRLQTGFDGLASVIDDVMDEELPRGEAAGKQGEALTAAEERLKRLLMDMVIPVMTTEMLTMLRRHEAEHHDVENQIQQSVARQFGALAEQIQTQLHAIEALGKPNAGAVA